MGWFSIAFFGIGVVVFVAELARPATLTISPEGMRTVQLGRVRDSTWDQVHSFAASTMRQGGLPIMRTITYETNPPPTTASRSGLQRLNSTLVALGLPYALTNTYGCDGTQLAAILNRYRDAAVGHHPYRPAR